MTQESRNAVRDEVVRQVRDQSLDLPFTSPNPNSSCMTRGPEQPDRR